jgi:S-adenosyl-L-methionine methyltransferase
MGGAPPREVSFMSRLESFIRRVCAQRSVLDHVVALVAGVEGPVLELGLGNGRTYDHLREKLPGRRIIAFDRALVAHASSVPPPENLVIGEIKVTASRFAGARGALVHADIETGYEAVDAETASWLAGVVPELLRQGGIAASGLRLESAALDPLPVPADVPKDRYFLYRRH